MPRSISVSRKYFPALSRDDSLPSSQRSLRGRRKPWGGGPAGVAARKVDVVKVAADEEVVRAARKALRGDEAGRARASTMSERVEAMKVAVRSCRKG